MCGGRGVMGGSENGRFEGVVMREGERRKAGLNVVREGERLKERWESFRVIGIFWSEVEVGK